MCQSYDQRSAHVGRWAWDVYLIANHRLDGEITSFIIVYNQEEEISPVDDLIKIDLVAFLSSACSLDLSDAGSLSLNEANH